MSSKNFMSYEDAEEILGEYAGEINQLKSGLTNVDNATVLNTQDLTTPSRTKNLLPMTLDRIKSSNTSGTWLGNVYTIGYNTYTVSVDNNGVVTSIEGTSTNIDSSAIKLDFDLKAGNYILSSGFVELFGANDTFLQKDGVTIARGNDASPGQNFTLSEDSELTWHFRVTNITKTCYPMIRPASITDPTFAPYIPSVESRIEAVESGLDDVNSNLTSLLLGNVKQIQLTQTYGHDQDKPINIDTINNPNGYVVKVRDSYTFTGTFPPLGSNNCLIIGFSAMTDQNAPIYGAQIAFAFGEDRIAIRHASYVQAGGTWGSWKVLDAVSP